MKHSICLLSLFVFIYLGIPVSCVSTKRKKNINKAHQEIKTNFPEAQVRLIQDSIKVIFPNNLVFGISSADLNEKFRPRLNRFASILNRYKKTNLLITGHTDDSGKEDLNMNLSLKRAESVKTCISEQKISSKRLFTWGLGEKNPIVSNETEEGRKKNRRVEFVVLYN